MSELGTREKAAGAGAVVAAGLASMCCILPIALGAVGLSAVVGWLDYVLLPALAAFIGMVVYALVRRHRATTT